MVRILASVLLFCYLLASSVIDVARKNLSVCFLSAGMIPAAAGVLSSVIGAENTEIMSIVISHIAGVLIGAGFILVSLITGEKLGKGDGLLFAVCGAAVGYEKLIILIMSAFLFGALYSVSMLAMGKLTGKSSFAFAPFIMIGYVMAEVLSGGVL